VKQFDQREAASAMFVNMWLKGRDRADLTGTTIDRLNARAATSSSPLLGTANVSHASTGMKLGTLCGK
jgi:hypothetical protein